MSDFHTDRQTLNNRSPETDRHAGRQTDGRTDGPRLVWTDFMCVAPLDGGKDHCATCSSVDPEQILIAHFLIAFLSSVFYAGPEAVTPAQATQASMRSPQAAQVPEEATATELAATAAARDRAAPCWSAVIAAASQPAQATQASMRSPQAAQVPEEAAAAATQEATQAAITSTPSTGLQLVIVPNGPAWDLLCSHRGPQWGRSHGPRHGE
jgi:hypothetical protein